MLKEEKQTPVLNLLAWLMIVEQSEQRMAILDNVGWKF